VPAYVDVRLCALKEPLRTNVPKNGSVGEAIGSWAESGSFDLLVV